jgi:hypothetical protein
VSQADHSLFGVDDVNGATIGHVDPKAKLGACGDESVDSGREDGGGFGEDGDVGAVDLLSETEVVGVETEFGLKPLVAGLEALQRKGTLDSGVQPRLTNAKAVAGSASGEGLGGFAAGLGVERMPVHRRGARVRGRRLVSDSY